MSMLMVRAPALSEQKYFPFCVQKYPNHAADGEPTTDLGQLKPFGPYLFLGDLFSLTFVICLRKLATHGE